MTQDFCFWGNNLKRCIVMIRNDWDCFPRSKKTSQNIQVISCTFLRRENGWNDEKQDVWLVRQYGNYSCRWTGVNWRVAESSDVEHNSCMAGIGFKGSAQCTGRADFRIFHPEISYGKCCIVQSLPMISWLQISFQFTHRSTIVTQIRIWPITQLIYSFKAASYCSGAYPWIFLSLTMAKGTPSL